ncbi:NTP transferase domain-containing protein [Tianweitania sp.]|uniref:NTP transferase domain-containing protein n=1 Tax=Tianweitania sp. TaxID=2021634 RepID=UPI002896C2A5|nr:NTP transferase domain-containing protein [Tianweitania sp.]
MTKPGTIVLPIAGRSSRFPGLRPKWMLTAPTGELMLEKSLASVADWRSRRVVIGALAEHLDGKGGRGALQRALGDAVEIVTFDDQTAGPAETVAEILSRADVQGPIFIKDCDSWFVPRENVFSDCVCYADLRQTGEVRNIAAKSFLHLNDNDLLLGIIEKNVSSNYISVGGYGFHDAHVFLDSYRRLLASNHEGEPFVSHVILDAIRQNNVFRGINTDHYVDVGTLEAWNRFREDLGLYIVDLDGVVLKNAGQYIPPLWDDPDQALPGNVAALKAMIARGAQIIFVTARPERFREKTEAFLQELGLSWHAAIFGVNHAARTLVNDFAPSNPFPSAVAINLVRNGDDLATMLPSAVQR